MKVQLTRRLGQNKAGSIIDRTHQEAQQLIQQGYGIHVDEPSPTVQPSSDEDTEADDQRLDGDETKVNEDDLDTLSLADLKERATQAGVATYGTKAEIAERIRTALTADVTDRDA